LELEGACQPVPGVGEDREQAVTLPLIGRQVSGMAEDGLEPELVVSPHRLAHLVGMLFPQDGRALDVSEEHRDGPLGDHGAASTGRPAHLSTLRPTAGALKREGSARRLQDAQLTRTSRSPSKSPSTIASCGAAASVSLLKYTNTSSAGKAAIRSAQTRSLARRYPGPVLVP